MQRVVAVVDEAPRLGREGVWSSKRLTPISEDTQNAIVWARQQVQLFWGLHNRQVAHGDTVAARSAR